jgi:hypothetical protein
VDGNCTFRVNVAAKIKIANTLAKILKLEAHYK